MTGATGFIGRKLVEIALAEGDDVRAFSRDAARARRSLGNARDGGKLDVVEWDYGSGPPGAGALAGLDAVIHLAGENVAGRRWTAAQKQRIRDSRVLSTRHLIEGLKSEAEAERPRASICASAIGFYGPRGDEDVNEEAMPGDDFLADVCEDWESEARRAEQHDVREARVRVGIVLGPGGGALVPLERAFRLFAGGPIGNGKQWMSWIHRDDVARIFLHAARDPNVNGPLNGTAPNPVRNREFSTTLGKALHRPSLIPAPRFALRIALGEFADVLTTGQKALPERTLASGFEYRYPELEGALREIFAD